MTGSNLRMKLLCVCVCVSSVVSTCGVAKIDVRSVLSMTSGCTEMLVSIYPEQDMSVMIDGLKLFLHDKSSDKVQLRFIGLDIIPSVSQYVKNELPAEFIYVSNRVSKEEAIVETKKATVLSYPGWLGTKGIISTKIFDYIASGNPILIAPGDKDIIDDLLIKTNTGESVFSAKEFAALLNKW